MLKINLFVEEKMQSKITEKFKISKSQKNNSIKLLVATIALYASLTASDEVDAILNDDALGAKAACKSVKYTRDNGDSSSEEMKPPKKVFPVLVTTTIAKTEIDNEQLAPTAANVIFGWGVFVAHSAGSALDYITPNFVKSFYNKGKAFCTSIGEIIGFFRTKK